MDEGRRRNELDLPARVPQTETKVDLLVEHEECLIEAADLLHRLAAEQKDRAHQELALPDLLASA